MKEIRLTQGKIALVDDEDFEALSLYKWHAVAKKDRHVKNWYAGRNIRVNGAWKPNRMMHQEIARRMGLDPNRVDHRDRNGLHNYRSNLRNATRSQNSANQRKRFGRASRFKGVTWDATHKKWRARITLNRVERHLGRFEREELAARAYDDEARKLFGEFALTNF